MAVHDPEFYRRELPAARRAAQTCEMADNEREVVTAALELLGALLAEPDTEWRPWHNY